MLAGGITLSLLKALLAPSLPTPIRLKTTGREVTLKCASEALPVRSHPGYQQHHTQGHCAESPHGHVSSPSIHLAPPHWLPVPPPGSYRGLLALSLQGLLTCFSSLLPPIEHFQEMKGLDSSPIQLTGPSTA